MRVSEHVSFEFSFLPELCVVSDIYEETTQLWGEEEVSYFCVTLNIFIFVFLSSFYYYYTVYIFARIAILKETQSKKLYIPDVTNYINIDLWARELVTIIPYYFLYESSRINSRWR